jgi:hypothetical protein
LFSIDYKSKLYDSRFQAQQFEIDTRTLQNICRMDYVIMAVRLYSAESVWIAEA